MRFLFASALAAAALLAGLSATAAHEGHDHGPAAPAARADAAPRGEATSDAFELVAVAQGETLVFYLDRFASNEPVRDATLAVEAPGGPVTAEAAGGAYRIKAPWLGKPGHTDLIVTVTAGDTADILPLSIDVPDRAAMQASGGVLDASAILRPSTALAVVFGALLGAGLMAYRGRRRVAAAAVLAGALLIGGDPSSAQDMSAGDAGPDRAARNADGSVFVPKPIQRIFALAHGDDRRGVASAHDRTAGPDHPRSECQRLRAGLGRRAAVAAARRLSAARHAGQAGRRARLCDAADAGDRRVRHAPAPGRARPADLHRRAPGRALRDAGAERRGRRASSSTKRRLELEGLKERRAALDQVRREPEALIAPVDGVVAEGTPVAGQMAQPNAVDLPDRRSGAAVGRGAELRRRWRGSTSAIARPRRTAGRCRWRSAARASPTATSRSRCISRSRARPAGLRAGQFVTVLVDHRRAEAGHRGAARQRACAARTGRTSSTSTSAPERFEPRAGAHRAARRRARAGRSRGSSRASASSCRAPNCSITCGERRCSPSSSPNRCATGCWCWR